MCEITPQKTRLKVAVDPKERPLLVKISSLHKPIPQVLRGLTFVISGRINEKDKSGVNSAEQLTPITLSNGGKVYTRDVAGAADANFILVTSQKELEKDVKRINKSIVHAYQFKWPIVSKQFVLDADEEKVCPTIDDYRLVTLNLDSAPPGSLVHARVVKQSEIIASGTKSAHRELKKSMRQKRKSQATEKEKSKDDIPKHKPKRPANGFIVFTKEKYAGLATANPEKSMSEINKILSNHWKALSDEDRMQYKEMGQSDFPQKTDKWNRALELPQSNNHVNYGGSLVLTRMN